MTIAFEFDRYINGRLMAEGVTIERATTFEEAAKTAARIAPRGPNREAPVLVLRSAAPASAGDEEVPRYTARQFNDELDRLTLDLQHQRNELRSQLTSATSAEPVKSVGDVVNAANKYVLERGIEHSGGIIESAFEAGASWAVSAGEQWQDISTYDLVPRQGEYFPPHALCAHAARGWIRMGRYEPTLKRWYYSGTNERSQWAQVEGDEPTHWCPLPSTPLTPTT